MVCQKDSAKNPAWTRTDMMTLVRGSLNALGGDVVPQLATASHGFPRLPTAFPRLPTGYDGFPTASHGFRRKGEEANH